MLWLQGIYVVDAVIDAAALVVKNAVAVLDYG